jgi:hypothetical protein
LAENARQPPLYRRERRHAHPPFLLLRPLPRIRRYVNFARLLLLGLALPGSLLLLPFRELGPELADIEDGSLPLGVVGQHLVELVGAIGE